MKNRGTGAGILNSFVEMTLGTPSPHSSGGDDEVCHCVELLEPRTFPPVVSCCESCPSCGLRIKRECFAIHVERCARELAEQDGRFDDISHRDDGESTRDGEFSKMF